MDGQLFGAAHGRITGKSTTLGDEAACGWSLAQCRRLPGIDMSIENGRRRHCVLLPDVVCHARRRPTIIVQLYGET